LDQKVHCFEERGSQLDISSLLRCITDLSSLTTQLANAIIIAMLLFLVASGLSLIFGVLGIGNFAHGSLYMIGAYLTYSLVSHFGNSWLAIILAPLGVGLLGIVVERFFISRIYGAPHIYQFLLTFGLLLILDDIARFIWGFNFRTTGFPKAFQRPPVFFLGSAIPLYYVFVIVIGILVALGLWFILSKTKFGKIVNAASSNSEMVESVGINVRLIYTLVFAIGAGLAGLEGFLAVVDAGE
jgi:branched-chain amino acid transport system permease protein